MNCVHLARRRKPIIDEAADVCAKIGVGVAIAQAARDGERMAGEIGGDARIRPAARNVARTAGPQVSVEVRRGHRPERRDGRKAIDRRNVLEDVPHPVAAAVGVANIERMREALRVGLGVTGLDEQSRDFGLVVKCLRIERVASEQVDGLEVREQAVVRIAARDALHFVHRQEFVRVDVLRKELVAARVVAAVVVPGDDQDVAAHALAPRGFQPIGTASLDELDEAIAIGRQVPAKRFLFVRGIDGDRADRLLRRTRTRIERAGTRLRVERHAAQQRQQRQCTGE